MKTFLKIFMTLNFLLAMSACATGTIQIPEKYVLDEQLELVTSIFKYGITDWEEIDNQSLIIQKGPGEYYLLVLKIPAYELPFLNRIKLTTTGDMIRAGMDNIILYDPSHIRQSYPIHRIYQFKNSEQMRAVRNQLKGEKDASQKDDKTVNPAGPGSIKDKRVET